MADTTGVTSGGLDARPLPAVGWVRFRAVDFAGLGLVAELGGTIEPSGYPAADVLDRGPGQVALTAAGSKPPLKLPIPLLLDRDGQRGSLENEMRVLDLLHGLDAGQDEAPTIIIEGVGVPHSYTGSPQLRWALDGDPEWGEQRYRAAGDGHRSYVAVTVTALQRTRPAGIAPAGGSSRRHFEVPKTGPLAIHTLRTIAKDRRVDDWRKLRKLNPALPGDPDLPIQPGIKVRVA